VADAAITVGWWCFSWKPLSAWKRKARGAGDPDYEHGEAEFTVAGRPMGRGSGLGMTLMGCEGIRQATGAAKLPPDEFTVLTKAPLVLPPDYNLRPPSRACVAQ